MKEVEEGSFKQWVFKTILVSIFFVVLILIAERVINVSLLRDVLIIVLLVMSIGFTHEALHYYQAVKLGYEPRWYRTKVTMGFEITHHTKREVWNKHKREIALLPYKVLIPIMVLIVIVGLVFDIWSFTLAGIVTLVAHGISIFKEGVDIKE